MTNKEKLEALKAFLTENNFEFEENHFSRNNRIVIDLYVKKLRIAVHLSDDKDDWFFKITKRNYHPFFIRENDTADFVIEKMQNCIIEEMTKLQKSFVGQQQAKENQKRHEEKVMESVPAPEKKKRKRITVKYEKVTRK